MSYFSGLAALAVINTHAAAAVSLITWVVIDAARGHVAISGACVGPIVGLVAITPACGFVQPGWALLIGIIATCIVYCLLLFKKYMRFDDTLDVAIVHGCGMLILFLFFLNIFRKTYFYSIRRRCMWCFYDWLVL